MHSILILSVYLGIVLLPFSTVVAQSLEPFDWEAGGDFYASGTFTGKSIFPPNNNAPTVSPSSIAFDVTHQRYTIFITSNHTQYGMANGTYYVDGGICSYVPVNYSAFVNVYKSALQITTENLVRIYSGLVHEPGACQQNVMVTLVRAEILSFKKLLSFSFSQVLNLALEAGLSPAILIPGKVFGSTQYDTYTSGTPNPSNFQLPPACWANPATVLNYCNLWYSTTWFNTPY